MTPAMMFKEIFGNQRNPLTPNVVGWKMVSETMAVELSWGQWSDKMKIYGVTFAEKVDGKVIPRHDLSKSFYHMKIAALYIKQVRAQLRKESKGAANVQGKVSV